MALKATPFWQLSKEEQKHEIEAGVAHLLEEGKALSPRQRVFVGEAIVAADRGCYGLAVQAILDVLAPDAAFSTQDRLPLEVGNCSVERLKAELGALRASPARPYQVFR